MMETSNIVPAALRRRRRRRKKNAPEKPHSAENLINRQDAELEREVDSYLNWGRGRNERKRRKRVYGSCDDDASSEKMNVTDDACDEEKKLARDANAGGEARADLSRVLPVILHLREVGLSRRSLPSWKSLLLHESQPPASDSSSRNEDADANDRYSYLSRLRIPVHPTASTNISRHNSLQYSSPTYYGINNDVNNLQAQQNDSSFCGNNIRLRRKFWRPYTRQSLPFSKLNTPLSDAVLAIDRSGGYLISVGGHGDTEKKGSNGAKGICPHFLIKFYGVPSPARLHQIQQNNSNYASQMSRTVSPLVHVVPLLFKNLGSTENRNFPAPTSILGYSEYTSPAAETPIQILLSDDGFLGVAFLHHSTAAAWSNNNGSATFSESPAMQDEDILGTIVIFEPPSFGEDCNVPKETKSFRCSNVRVGGWNSFTMRNSLWRTTIVPASNTGGPHVESNGTSYIMRASMSAYMLFNDEDDGFRITWVTTGDNLEENRGMPATNSPNNIRPTRSDIFEVFASAHGNWEECFSDRETGHRREGDAARGENHSRLNVAYEAYLRVDALLCDITSRRQSSLFKKSPYQNLSFVPDFFYNLISASGLKVLLVIVFSNLEKMIRSAKTTPSALGVFVEINLFGDHSYEELKWVQHPTCRDSSSMKQWCNSLALNWRMKQCRVGVFCLDNCKIGPQMEQWVGGAHECNVDEDLDDDFNVDLWGDYVKRKSTSRRKDVVAAPKDISISNLYPNCDVITNRAVHNAIPVKRMASRSSPIELVYG